MVATRHATATLARLCPRVIQRPEAAKYKAFVDIGMLDSLSRYAEFLQESPGEAQALHQDLLISVTCFFRDPGAYEALRASVFPHLLRERSARDPVRIWIAGCSTGCSISGA